MLNATVNKMGICNEYVQKARNYNITTKAKALKRLSAAYAKKAYICAIYGRLHFLLSSNFYTAAPIISNA